LTCSGVGPVYVSNALVGSRLLLNLVYLGGAVEPASVSPLDLATDLVFLVDLLETHLGVVGGVAVVALGLVELLIELVGGVSLDLEDVEEDSTELYLLTSVEVEFIGVGFRHLELPQNQPELVQIRSGGVSVRAVLLLLVLQNDARLVLLAEADFVRLMVKGVDARGAGGLQDLAEPLLLGAANIIAELGLAAFGFRERFGGALALWEDSFLAAVGELHLLVVNEDERLLRLVLGVENLQKVLHVGASLLRLGGARARLGAA